MSLFKKNELLPYTSPITGLKVYPVKVDIKTGLASGKSISFTTGDINSSIIAVALYDGDNLYTTEGKSIVGNIVRPDKTSMTVLGRLVEENYYEFNLGYTGISQEGVYSMDIECSWENTQVTTPIFSYRVTRAITIEDSVQEDDRFPILTELINEVESKLVQIEAKLSELVDYGENLSTKFEEYKEATTGEINAFISEKEGVIDTKLSEVDGKLQEASQSLVSVNEKLTETEGLITQVTGQIEEVESAMQGVTEKLPEIDNKLLEVATKLQEIEKAKQNMISSINQKIDEVDNKLASVDETVTGKMSEVDTTITNKLSDVDSKVSEKFTNVDTTLNNKLGELTTKVDDKLVEVDNKLENIGNTDVDLDPIRQDIATHETRLTAVEEQNAVQDIYIESLLNDKNNNKVSITANGNVAELVGSVDGKVEVTKVIGNTITNFWNTDNLWFTGGASASGGFVDFMTGQQEYSNFFFTDKSVFKPDTQYTIIAEVVKNEMPSDGWIFFTSNTGGETDVFTAEHTRIRGGQTGKFVFNLTTKSNVNSANYGMRSFVANHSGWFGMGIKLRLLLVEGNYTVNQLPRNYFTGSKSFLSDTKITQEMVSGGTESSENLNKYKCKFITRSAVSGGFEKTKSVYLTTPLLENDELVYREDGVYHFHKIHPVVGNESLPQLEKISNEKITLDIKSETTLTVVSEVPCTSMDLSYTSNVPSVYKLEETGINNSLDIEVTQQAVDFLLMSTVGVLGNYNKYNNGGSNMGAYFASRILKRALKYSEVIEKYPEFKEDIDFILKSEGREDLMKM